MASTGTGTYTVKFGDTWQSIGRRYGISPSELARQNRNVAKPSAGTIVKVPKPFSPFKPAPGPKPQVAQTGGTKPYAPPIPPGQAVPPAPYGGTSLLSPTGGERKFNTGPGSTTGGQVVNQGGVVMPPGVPQPWVGYTPLETAPGNPQNWNLTAAVDDPANQKWVQYWNPVIQQWGKPVRVTGSWRNQVEEDPAVGAYLRRERLREGREEQGPKPPSSRPEDGGGMAPGHRQMSPGLPDTAASNYGGGYTIPQPPPRQFWQGPRYAFGGGVNATGRYFSPEFPGLVSWRI